MIFCGAGAVMVGNVGVLGTTVTVWVAVIVLSAGSVAVYVIVYVPAEVK